VSSTPAPEALDRLEGDGILSWSAGVHRTTRRWQAAMARAALTLQRDGKDDGCDLRVPIALALLDFYEGEREELLVDLVEVLLPIEAAELDPRIHISSAG
jgi:hypothetical protein